MINWRDGWIRPLMGITGLVLLYWYLKSHYLPEDLNGMIWQVRSSGLIAPLAALVIGAVQGVVPFIPFFMLASALGILPYTMFYTALGLWLVR